MKFAEMDIVLLNDVITTSAEEEEDCCDTPGFMMG